MNTRVKKMGKYSMTGLRINMALRDLHDPYNPPRVELCMRASWMQPR